jgi:hypothetical protein
MTLSPLFDRTTAFFAAAAFAALGLLLRRPEFVDPVAAWLFVLAIWVGLAACALYLRQTPQPPMPFLPLTVIFYVVFFALPPFLIEPGWWGQGGPPDHPTGILLQELSVRTALIVLLGLSALVSAYYATRAVVPRWRPLMGAALDVPEKPLRVAVWALAILHVLYLYMPTPGFAAWLSQAMMPLGYFVCGMLLILWLRGRLNDVEKIIFWGVLIPLELFAHFVEGLITPIVLLFVFFVSIYWYRHRRFGVILILGALFAFYIFPVLKLSNFFIAGQTTSWIGQLSEKADALKIAVQLFSGTPAPNSSAPAAAAINKNVVAPILRRVSLVVLLQHCVDKTPGTIPYLEGETLKNLATNVVPRVLWPGKPAETLGQWFGHRYEILLPDDDRTSINVPWLVEFYVNFGIPGVVLGMLAVGVAMAILEALLLNGCTSDPCVIAGWALIFRLAYQESNLSLMLGSLLSQVVFLYVFLWVVFRLSARLAARPA